MKPCDLVSSDIAGLIGLVTAAISHYEIRRVRLLVDPSQGWDVGQLRAFYASEIEKLNRTLAKLHALDGAPIKATLQSQRRPVANNHPHPVPQKVTSQSVKANRAPDSTMARMCTDVSGDVGFCGPRGAQLAPRHAADLSASRDGGAQFST
jgi:hypothetical protein